VRYVK
jgi:hypothetical protein